MDKAERLLTQTGEASERMSRRIGAAMNSSSTYTRNLGRAFSDALGRVRTQGEAFNRAASEADRHRETVAALREEYNRQNSAIEQAKVEISQLTSRYNDLKAASQVTANASAGTQIRTEMAALGERITASTEALREQGTTLAETESQLRSAGSAFNEAADEADHLSNEMEEASGSAGRLKRSLDFNMVGRTIGTLVKNLSGISAMQSLVSHLKNAASAGGSLDSATKRVTRSINGLGSMIYRRIIRMGITAAFKNVGTAMESLQRHSSSVKNAMTSLSTGMKGVSASLVGAFAPVLTSIQPILSGLINMVTTAINAVNQFFAKLSGASSWKKAVATSFGAASSSAGSAADSAGKATEAAEEYKRTVMGFDQLNKLDEQSKSSGSGGSGGGGGGGGGGGDSSDGITWVDMPIDNDIAKFAEMFKDAWEKADFTEIGRIVGEKLRDALNDIPWDAIKEQCNKIAKSTATFLNGFFETPGLFEAIGRTVGEGLNTAFGTVHTFLDTLHFDSITKAFATGIQTAFQTFDFSLLGAVASDIPKKIFDGIRGAIEGIDWSAVPGDIVKAIADFFRGYDVSGIASSFGAMLGVAIRAGIELIGSIGDLIGDGFFALGDYFQSKIEECGGNVVAGIFKGITDAIKGVGTWIKTNLFDPIIKGFKDAFGIHSPSTVMAEMGGYLIEGLLKGLKDTVQAIKDFFLGLVADVAAFFRDPIGTMKIVLDGGWDTAKAAWDSIQNSTVVKTLKGAVDALFTSAKEAWDTIKNSTAVKTISGLTSTLFATVKGAWDALADSTVVKTISGLTSSLFATVKSAWDAIQSSTVVKTISGLTSTLYATVKGAWDTITDSTVVKTISGLTSTLFATVKNAWDSIVDKTSTVTIDFLKSAWDKFQDFLKIFDTPKEIVVNIVMGVFKAASNIAQKAWELIFGTPVYGDEVETEITINMRGKVSEVDTSGLTTEDKTIRNSKADISDVDTSQIKNWKVSKGTGEVLSLTDGIPVSQKKITGIEAVVQSAKDGLTTAQKTFNAVGNFVSKAINGLNASSDNQKAFATFNSVGNFVGKAISGKTANSDNQKKFATFNSVGNFVSKSISGQQANSNNQKKFATFNSTANMVSKSFGRKFSFTVGGMNAHFTGKSVDKHFDKGIDNFRAYFRYATDKIPSQYKVSYGWRAGISGTTRVATGGLLKNGSWRPVQQFAAGGLPSMGQMFVAREAGPELVGTIGGNTAVVNNNQIVASVAAGVAQAVAGVLSSNNRRSGDIVLYVDSKELARASLRGQSALDAQMNPTIVFG